MEDVVGDPAGKARVGQRSVHKVLYIEDNAANLRVVERVFDHRADLELLSAMRGLEGFELACDHRPSVVLLDVHLPDIDGAEVLRRLRGDVRTDRIPVVVLSADANVRQIQRFLESGAVAYLTKPLDIQQLSRIVDDLIREVGPPTGPRAS